MENKELYKYIDHTVLSQTATFEDIKKACDEAIEYGAASICIPPCFVERVKDHVGDKIKVCTVIGFPNGYNTTDVKEFEALQAISLGADEIDMVININELRAKNYEYLAKEIVKIKNVCEGKVLKVIVECCLLTDQEKAIMCKLVSRAKAEYIKTSTGFSTGGAKKHDVVLFKKNIENNTKIKAAGGIKTIEDAKEYISLGCDRIGSSSLLHLIAETEKNKK